MQNWLFHLFNTTDLSEAISALSFWAAGMASLALIILVVLAGILKERYPKLKAWLFGLMLLIISFGTFILIGSTVYLNTVSASRGPVHWHADFELWACGQQLELKDPEGFFSNKIGTSTLHEHNDQRIHLEGVVVEPRDASLGKFMRVIGGSITKTSVVVPAVDGPQSYINGQNCNSRPSTLQVFVYQTTPDNYYKVTKLSDPAEYVIRDESVVPPGDCIIVEFDDTPDTTEQMCLQYEVALDLGKLKGLAQ